MVAVMRLEEPSGLQRGEGDRLLKKEHALLSHRVEVDPKFVRAPEPRLKDPERGIDVRLEFLGYTGVLSVGVGVKAP